MRRLAVAIAALVAPCRTRRRKRRTQDLHRLSEPEGHGERQVSLPKGRARHVHPPFPQPLHRHDPESRCRQDQRHEMEELGEGDGHRERLAAAWHPRSKESARDDEGLRPSNIADHPRLPNRMAVLRKGLGEERRSYVDVHRQTHEAVLTPRLIHRRIDRSS